MSERNGQRETNRRRRDKNKEESKDKRGFVPQDPTVLGAIDNILPPPTLVPGRGYNQITQL